MVRVILEGSDLEVSRFSFGTASLHRVPWSRERQQLLSAAFEKGFSHFDTAPYYGYGIAEHELGRFLRTRKHRVTVATKVGLYPPGYRTSSVGSVWVRKAVGKWIRSVSMPRVDWSLRHAEASLDQSLKTLGVSEIDLLLLHEPDAGAVDADSFVAWVELERRKGRIRGWGLAGDAQCMLSWVPTNHPIAQTLQVRDSMDLKEADQLHTFGRAAQITFGHVSALRRLNGATSLVDIIRTAMDRNRRGTILMSTTRVERIQELSAIVEGLGGTHN